MAPTRPTLTSAVQLFLLGGMAYFPVFLLEFTLFDQVADQLSSGSDKLNEVYDFIIVGSGSSGAVVANRLSEQYKVLLLEAGGEPNPLMSIPATAGLFPNNPTVDWAFKTVPQKHSCFALNKQQSLWPRGKALGGTSNLNFMAYIRGHPRDYDNWAKISGDTRWSYRRILDYFKRSENYHSQDLTENTAKYHGFGGDLNIEPASYNPLAPYFIRAAKQLGYRQVDLNGPYDEGFNQFYFTSKRGRRYGAYQAFLQDIRGKRGNRLTIYKYAFVTKVLFRKGTKEAYAVEYTRHSQNFTAYASKEIILSAGTIGTPKILMASGVGPKEHLTSLGIKPVVDLPVGKNLQDHVVALVGPFTIDKRLTFLPDRDMNPAGLLTYFATGTGPLSASGVGANGFFLSNFSGHGLKKGASKWPDVQLILLGLPVQDEGPKILANIFNLKDDVAETYYRPVAGKDSFHIMSMIARPKSRGDIRLASIDPKVPPLIDPKYLEHPDDVSVILEGIKKALDLVERTESFQSIGAKLSPTPFPGCEDKVYRSQEYWECYIRQYTVSVYHPAGTCAMGKPSDPDAVVNSKLQVLGTEHLRVIDASIQPRIVSSNIQAICIAIGEIGSDFIRETWENRIR